MKHKRFGFTLVEIALFLAVTGALFVGIIAGTQNSIRAQRYNDSVQSFANFWRDIYASVSNTQNLGSGRSDQAIYGKLVVFGEKYDFEGNTYSGQKIYYYDVIGKVATSATNTGSSTLEALSLLNANVVVVEKNGNDEDVYPSGFMDSYVPTWSATIEKAKDTNNKWPFTGSVLVVKHPRSTNISTYYSSTIIEVNEALNPETRRSSPVNLLKDALNSFSVSQIDFCVNSDDIGQNRIRRQNVRLVKNANNVSSVEIISADKSNNLCTHQEGGA